MTDVKMKLHLCKEPDKFQFVILLNGLHPRKVESVFVISTKDFDLEPKATTNRKGKYCCCVARIVSNTSGPNGRRYLLSLFKGPF